MAQVESGNQGVVRDRRTAGVVALLAVFLLVGFGPRNQRALFATQPFGTMAEAFTAVPDASLVSYPGRGGAGSGDIAPAGGAGRGVGTPYAGPAGPLASADGPGGAADTAGPTSTPLSELATAPEAGQPLPGYGTLPGGTTEPGAGGGPGEGPGPGGGGDVPGGPLPGGSPTPVAPVPEPASWAIMIGGIAVVGSILRRRARARAAEAA